MSTTAVLAPTAVVSPCIQNYFLSTTAVLDITAVVSSYNLNIKKLVVPTIVILETITVISPCRTSF